MNLANELFRCFVESIQKEIKRIQDSGVLDHCPAKPGGRGQVLNAILKKETWRLFALRALYEATDAPRFTFQAECPCEEGAIDLVLVEGAEQYAFEFKRWQTEGEPGILGKDHEKLISFMRVSGDHHGYSVILTDNENKEMIASEKFQHDKPGFYTDAFKERLGGKYHLCEWKVIEFGTFTACALLAAPKQDAHRA